MACCSHTSRDRSLRHSDRQRSRFERTLDYGAGPHAYHTWALREAKIECHAWDFGRNYRDGVHSSFALSLRYNTVMLSSVLNAQRSRGMLRRTLAQARNAVSRSGRLVLDFLQPAYRPGISLEEIVVYLTSQFRHVVEISPGLFECYDEGTPLRQVRSVVARRIHQAHSS